MTTLDPFAEFRMSGHCALVTGGAQNIGAAITRIFAGAGAKVMNPTSTARKLSKQPLR
jgi:7-alpha-hydroxysteroid dehydrogenase